MNEIKREVYKAQAQRKAFSTCTSHLAVVTLFYTTCMFNYNRPSSGHPLYVDTLASVLYNVVTPMLNPLIYCLRNKEEALWFQKTFPIHKKYPNGSSLTYRPNSSTCWNIEKDAPEQEMGNWTAELGFTLLGFSTFPEQHKLVFVALLAVYLTALVGNGMILIIVQLDSGLQTPMYYLLQNLSFLDICYISVTLPQMLNNLLEEDKAISFQACFTQLFFLITFVGVECILLAIMAYDRYLAICHPLRYAALMSRKTCLQLAVASWTCGLLNSALHTGLTSVLPFCASHHIAHLFCDVPQLLKLSCSDTSLNKVVLLAVTVLLGAIPFLCIVVSYVAITRAVLQIRFAQAQRKAFSTCASHLAVVTLFYTTCMFNYNRPSSGHNLYVDTLASVLYNVVTPMLNPLIYCLRNKEVKAALKHVIGQKNSSLKT
ncbi:olfactory receptor 5V1-like [Malaclemys terrapin pileata]|uniref:olfactory receptor 5V1-like n=1 Tax=Malaclemys terrapin pileata TaxID=2991368 RepID=UPI0023A8FF58|nr:olfactory receptor 5V1-like [Malaclemys terrapin pileata]